MAHKILLVDDSDLVRRTLRGLIDQNLDWRVCGEANNGITAIEMVKKLNPNLVILDLFIPGMNGLETAQQIARIAPQVPVLMFTMHASDQLFREAQQVGVRNVISKCSGAAHLIPAMQNILESGIVPTPALSSEDNSNA